METSLLNFQDLSLPQRPLHDSLKSCFAVNRYDRWTFFVIIRSYPVWGMSLYQTERIFSSPWTSWLFQLSGALARRLFCIPWYFVVPHFISFNCKLLNTQFSHKEKETIQSVWSDLMTLLFPDWLTPPLLFFLYIFMIPPGWFGRIRKPLHSKPLNTSSILNQPVRYKSQ